jgi:hypothetical protein
MGARMQPHLYLSIITYRPEVHIAVFNSILNSVPGLTASGWLLTVQFRQGDADLSRSRNATVQEFLATTCTDMICIDSDISWKPGALEQLLMHPVELVAGVYRQRVDPEWYPVGYLEDPEGVGLNAVDPRNGRRAENGLIEVTGVPAGFLRIARSCAVRMSGYYASHGFPDSTVSTGTNVGLFDFETTNGGRWSEDLTFCRRWREIGGRIWVDPNIPLTHHGYKDYPGHFGNWLKSRPIQEAA